MNRQDRRRQAARQRQGAPTYSYQPKVAAGRSFLASLDRSGPRAHREGNDVRDDIRDVSNRRGFPTIEEE
jgi:hypothetical protein